MTVKQAEVVIACDGACCPNPGPGGWGVILRCGEAEKELSGFDPATSNNRMELTAALRGLAALTRPCRVTVISDSQYLVKGMTIWRLCAKPKAKNRDLWQAIASAAEPHTVRWEWVRGHNGHPLNERADALANRAARLAAKAA